MHFHRQRPAWLRLAFALALAAPTITPALEPTTPLDRLGRQSWSMESGLPQNTVPVLLQQRNGFLWAGTELGLARFDGVSFRIIDHATSAPFPDAEIRCLLDGRASQNGQDGQLWVGTTDGLVLERNGQSTLLTTANGLPSNSIRGLAQTADGTLWVWTEAGLARIHSPAQPPADQLKFDPILSAPGLPSGSITSIATDSQSGPQSELWLATTTGTARYTQGQWQPVPISHPGPSLVVADASGSVLLSTPDGVFLASSGHLTQLLAKSALPVDGVSFLTRLKDGAVAAASKSTLVLSNAVLSATAGAPIRFSVGSHLPGSRIPGTRIEILYADREGSLWVGTNRGLARIPSPGTHPTPSVPVSGSPVQLLPTTDPLASSAIVSLLEDSEGDLWVGTETSGLHILRDARFHIVSASNGLSSDSSSALIEDTQHTIWIGTRDAGLNHIAAGKTTTLSTSNGLLSNVILSLAAAPDGSVWVGTPDGLNRISHGQVTAFTSADGLPDDFIRSLLVAPDNSLWIGTRRGLTHFNHGHFQTFTQSSGLGSDLVGAMVLAPNGDLWVATLNGLTRLHNGVLHNFTAADGLSSNVITALDITSDGSLFVGTQSGGLNLFTGQKFQPIRDSARRLPAVIHALMHDNSGQLWLATDSGLTRVPLAALLACAQSASCDPPVTTFTTADGLRSREASSNSHPTALRTTDGQLWFSTPRGVVVADPQHFAAQLPAPPVVIERFAVDDRESDSQDLSNPTIRVAAGHLRFEFDYAGLSFAAPQKLRYQYMLEGFDHVWTDAGTRRTAYYTNIPPGPYRFRVRANFGGEPGPPSETSLQFQLLPHFYQTAWFIALLVLAAAALVLFVIRRRVLLVEREFRAVMAERNRIAREIHDTLAQGYVGISVQLEVLGELLRQNLPGAAAVHLERTKAQVREGLDDARQSIWALRSQDSAEQTLPIRLSRLVEKVHSKRLTATFDAHGAYRPLAPETEKELLRIAQEAMQNALKHASATHLTVRLEYREHSLALTIADNGKGFDVVHAPSPTGGHYGLTGMRERAALIHARIAIESQPGHGATIRVEVDAPAADHAQQPHDPGPPPPTSLEEDPTPAHAIPQTPP
jgi:ligand-binding sensor domain-containing protein/signal transduction histidine kinase